MTKTMFAYTLETNIKQAQQTTSAIATLIEPKIKEATELYRDFRASQKGFTRVPVPKLAFLNHSVEEILNGLTVIGTGLQTTVQGKNYFISPLLLEGSIRDSSKYIRSCFKEEQKRRDNISI